MHIQIDNLGVIRKAEFEVGDLTIICGDNNTGKTYISYALYGFLDFWWKSFDLVAKVCGSRDPADIADGNEVADQCLKLKDLLLLQASRDYVRFAPDIFATSKDFLADFTFSANFSDERFTWDTLSALLGKQWETARNQAAHGNVADAPTKAQWDYVLKKTLSTHVPNPFLITAERSGILNLWNELDTAREPWSTFGGAAREKGESTLPLPIQRNIDFVRAIRNDRFRTPSTLMVDQPNFFDDFEPLFGGTFEVHDGTHFFVPENESTVKLRMPQSSSSVRSLFLLYYYLRYLAQPGDILMIDEPELNLHPEKQRLVARLFARLVHYGIRVFATTHSDYLIRELNVLIMLGPRKEEFGKIVAREKYRNDDFLSVPQLHVYTAEPLPTEGETPDGFTLYPTEIDQQRGIEVKTFDRTIFRTNSIMEKLIYGS